MDFLTALEIAAPPPAGVERLPAEAWAQFEAENGFVPPADFRALVDHYGAGGFGYQESTGPWLSMLHPVGAGKTFVEQSAWERSLNTGLQRQFPDQEPDWPMWPSAGGFLPWAGSIDGHQIGWLTEGQPDSWPTGIYGKGEHFRLPYGCVEFVYRWLTGTSGWQDHDDGAARDRAEGGLRFFPSRPPDPTLPAPSMTEITVALSGIGAGGSEREAIAIVDRWLATVDDAGVTVRSYGCVRFSAEEPLHWEVVIDFEPAQEESAKALVARLADELGIGIRECRNLEYDLVWDDVVRRTG